MSQPRLDGPVSINFHLWPRCNMHCHFCYAGFPEARRALPSADAARLIGLLARAGAEKITFVGGEPTLHPALLPLVQVAAAEGLTTCVVTNGAALAPLLVGAGDALRWVGLSVDSADEHTQRSLGRGRGDHLARMTALADQCHARGVRLKLNTVVTALTWQEDMRDLVRRLAPERWKVFQVLRIDGENDGKVEPLLITAAQFQAFVDRHRALDAEGLGPIAEDNDAMLGSYVMINPEGCFFSNEHGRYVVSEPILRVGVAAALAQVSWRSDKFLARGGVYDW
jgi:radical S-adenosyl methionine domain-containing protein 2